MHNPICPPIECREGYATNQQLGVRTVGQLARVLTSDESDDVVMVSEMCSVIEYSIDAFC